MFFKSFFAKNELSKILLILEFLDFNSQCPPLNRITLVYCLYVMGPALFYYNKWLILLSVIQLSGKQCIKYSNDFVFVFKSILKKSDMRAKCKKSRVPKSICKVNAVVSNSEA
jgi:hypothetical protein